MTIEPQDNDVISMNQDLSLIKFGTFKVSQLRQDIERRVGALSSEWLGEGANCEFLEPLAGDGWRKGKIRLRLEFVPDKELGSK